MKKFLKLAMFALVVAVAATSCTVVDNSEVGIKFKKFGLTDQGELNAIPVTGWVFYNPFTTSVFTYPTFVQTVDYAAFEINSKDGTKFSMDPKLVYYIDRSQATHIFSTYRKPLDDIEQEFMETYIYNAYRIVANRYTADELMANRGSFEDEVEELLRSTMDEEGFRIKEFTSAIVPPASLQATIDEKNKAVQNALKAENEVKEAEANAKIEIAKAEGEAQALRIKADGEAYYNRTVAASLNPLLVQQYAIEKWDGDMPMYTGGGAIPFIDVNAK